MATKADPATTIADYLLGTFAGLIAVIVVATMFITAEYRRGLIRTTLAASPRRGRVLAAKAIVIGSVTFVAGLVAPAVAVTVGEQAVARQRLVRVPGDVADRAARRSPAPRRCSPSPPSWPWPSATMLRRSAAAVTTVIVAIVLPVHPGASPPSCPSASRTGCCGSPRPPPSPSSRAVPQYPQVTALYSPGVRLLPAGAVGRPRRAVRLRRARPGPGRCPAPPEGRMSEALAAGRTWRAATCRTGQPARRAARGMDQAAHRGRPGLAAGRHRRADRGGQRRGDGSRPMPGRHRLPGRHHQAQPHRGRARPGGRRHPGRAGDQRRVQHRHDPHHPRRDAAPVRRPGRQGRHPHRPGAGRRDHRRRSAPLLAGRLILPGHGFTAARGFPPLSLARRADAARRRRLGPLPRPDRPAQPRHRHRRAGLRGRPSGSSSACCTSSRSSPARSPTRTGSGTSSRSGR